MAAAADSPQVSQTTQKVSDVIAAYRPSKLFRTTTKPTDTPAHITSLDFDDTGDYLITASDSETLSLYDIKEGKSTKTVPSKKYGCHLARFTHHSRQILHASTKVDDSLRLLDLHSESFTRYFSAHAGGVTSLAVSPSNDTFLSCGRDNMVCLWDIASRHPQGKLNLSTPYLATYDPSASVIAIASQSTFSILLYDIRNYDKAPFVTFDMADLEARYSAPQARGKAWTKMEFSNDGKSLLLSTDMGGHFLLDAFDGRLRAYLSGRQGPSGRAAPVSSSGKPLGQGDTAFTPDGRFVVGGVGGGEKTDLLVWDARQADEMSGGNSVLAPMMKLPGRARAQVVVCNPRYNMMATADRETVLWLPEEGAGKADGA